MRRLVERRGVRAVVLLLALGVGGVAGAPAMALPPRSGISISGGEDDVDGDDPGGGGGGGGGGPLGPNPPLTGAGVNDSALASRGSVLSGAR